MTSFLTPDPIVIEARNASGFVAVDLSDTTMTTVEITQLQGTGIGLIDDIISGLRRGSDPVADQNAIDAVRVDLQVQEGGTVLIVDTDPARAGWRSAFGVRITAPARSGIRVQTQSADVRVSGRADRLDVRTASGDVDADHVDRGALVHTASGTIRIGSIGQDAELRSSSGDIVVERGDGTLSLQSTSGDVRVLAPARDVFARTVSGSIAVLDAVTGTVEATAVSGDVEVAVHAGSLARIELSTVSGSTRNDFELLDSPGPVADADQPEGVSVHKEPAGRLEISCRTTSGNIRLRRAAVAALG